MLQGSGSQEDIVYTVSLLSVVAAAVVKVRILMCTTPALRSFDPSDDPPGGNAFFEETRNCSSTDGRRESYRRSACSRARRAYLNFLVRRLCVL